MTIAAFSLTSGAGGGSTSATTASITPTANRLVLLAVSASSYSTADYPSSIVGNGMTWNLVQENFYHVSNTTLALYWALSASPSAGTIVITYPVAKNDILWSIIEFSGVNTTTPIVQSSTNKGTSNLATTTLSAFGNTNNTTYGVGASISNTLSVEAGYTSGHSLAGTTIPFNMLSEYLFANDTSVTESISNSETWAMIGVEIAATTGIDCSMPVAAVSSTSNATSYAFSAFTPAANATLVMQVFATGTVATGSVTGGSLTWALKDHQVYDTGDTAYIFWANTGATPSSSTFAFDCTGDAATGCVATILQFIGSDVVRADPIKQTAKSATTAANPSVTFSTALDTNNGYCAGFGVPRNPAGSTQPTNWTQVADTGYNAPSGGAAVAYRVKGETGTTVTFTSASAAYGMIAAEIYAAASGTAYFKTLTTTAAVAVSKIIRKVNDVKKTTAVVSAAKAIRQINAIRKVTASVSIAKFKKAINVIKKTTASATVSKISSSALLIKKSTEASSAALNKAKTTIRTISTASTITAKFIRKILAIKLYNEGSAAKLHKTANLSKLASAVSAPSMHKAFSIYKLVTTSSSSYLSKSFIKFKTLPAVIAATSKIVRMLDRTGKSTAAATGIVIKQSALVKKSASATTSKIIKQAVMIKIALIIGIATLAKSFIKFKTLFASSAATAISLIKQAIIRLISSLSNSSIFAKSAILIRKATSTSAAILNALKVKMMLLFSSSTSLGITTKATLMLKKTTSGSIAVVNKLYGKIIAATVSSSIIFDKLCMKILSAVSTTVKVIKKAFGIFARAAVNTIVVIGEVPTIADNVPTGIVLAHIFFSAKRPNEITNFSFDIVNLLATGEDITGLSCAISIKSGVDSAVSTMAVGGAMINGTLISQKVQGGVNGNFYFITFTATTAYQTLQIIGVIPVSTGE